VPANRVRKIQITESEGYKELTYNPDGTLASVVLYNSPAKTTVLQTKVFTYSGGNLSNVTVTYLDGLVVTKVFGFTGDTLTSVAS
jgi:hypothetical protein